MLRTVCPEPTLVGSLFRRSASGAAGRAGRGGRLLDDPRFFEPFRPFFIARIGRPSIPMETFLRMMFLKYRYRLGFETLCAEVADWSAGGGSVVSRSTGRCRILPPLKKIARVAGSDSDRGAERGAVGQGGRSQGDQDWTSSGRTPRSSRPMWRYPTDAGLLAKGVVRMAGWRPDSRPGVGRPHPDPGPDPLGAPPGS